MRRIVLILLACCSVSRLAAAAPSSNYLGRLREALAAIHANLPAITTSAELAARGFLAGGNLWVAGRQDDFMAEACGRAGGLMAIRALGKQGPTDQDTILYAVRGRLEQTDTDKIAQWRANGVSVVVFASTAGLFDNRVPLDTVINVGELWTWTGEFVGACTRRGKMPILYLSYGLPGGPERGKKYQGKKVHDDLIVKPFAPGVLGKAYLDQIDAILKAIDDTEMNKIRRASEWWRQTPTNSAMTLVTGHMFPRHALDSRTPLRCAFGAAPAWEDSDLSATTGSAQFVFVLGYQRAPQKLVDRAKASGLKLVYSTVQPAQPPEPAANILYLNPHWPLTDACITVPGYDIPILPASGVAQAALYWTLVSEALSASRR